MREVSGWWEVLVTTRMRGLLPHASELECGLLTEQEAMALLLEQAELEEEPPLAGEVLRLCGRLALTVSIAGGMVQANGGIDEDLLEVMRVRGRAQSA